MIPVSGGKDSTYQTYVVKHEFGLNPLCVSYHLPEFTELGRKNLENLKRLERGNLKFIDQVHSEATYAKKIDKDETIGQWQKSGPFEIDKDEYNLGEKIFLSVQNINANDKGEVKFMRPLNITHSVQYIGIPFDGMKKDGFNYYFQPR